MTSLINLCLYLCLFVCFIHPNTNISFSLIFSVLGPVITDRPLMYFLFKLLLIVSENKTHVSPFSPVRNMLKKNPESDTIKLYNLHTEHFYAFYMYFCLFAKTEALLIVLYFTLHSFLFFFYIHLSPALILGQKQNVQNVIIIK